MGTSYRGNRVASNHASLWNRAHAERFARALFFFRETMAESAALCRVKGLDDSNSILTGRYRRMTKSIQEEGTSPELAVMTRTQVVDELMNFPGAARLDFTDEFVANQSLDQLKVAYRGYGGSSARFGALSRDAEVAAAGRTDDVGEQRVSDDLDRIVAVRATDR